GDAVVRGVQRGLRGTYEERRSIEASGVTLVASIDVLKLAPWDLADATVGFAIDPLVQVFAPRSDSNVILCELGDALPLQQIESGAQSLRVDSCFHGYVIHVESPCYSVFGNLKPPSISTRKRQKLAISIVSPTDAFVGVITVSTICFAAMSTWCL